MSPRAFTSHNHASRAAAVAECMRAGMTPWHDRDFLLFAMPESRERFAIARYRHAGAPRWAIVPEATLRECIAGAERAAAGREREAAAYRHALGEPEPAGLEVTEYATPGQEAAAGCPVELLEAAVHNEPAVSNSGGF